MTGKRPLSLWNAFIAGRVRVPIVRVSSYRRKAVSASPFVGLV